MYARQERWELVADYAVSGQDYFYRLAYGQVRDREAALDIVQEAIAKALDKAHTLREPNYLKTWFYRILINECMDYFRRNRNVIPLEESLDLRAEGGIDPGDRVDLYDALAKLEERERLVVQLRFFEDMKLEEISRVTDTNLNTVKTRLYGALRKLRVLTGEEVDQYEREAGRGPKAL
ncbi:MAG: sigma-70 family RNA polymerase sigma factor [Oscillospiraceae bacterium]|nr:sigma-70 family RNA polymerase sigma factor [Oscillospiraceae bacterium]